VAGGEGGVTGVFGALRGSEYRTTARCFLFLRTGPATTRPGLSLLPLPVDDSPPRVDAATAASGAFCVVVEAHRGELESNELPHNVLAAEMVSRATVEKASINGLAVADDPSREMLPEVRSTVSQP
jgi:hypothetical protein